MFCGRVRRGGGWQRLDAAASDDVITNVARWPVFAATTAAAPSLAMSLVVGRRC